MPKRMIDSSFLDSPSMEALTPGAQDAFPRFILMADDFGCFEVNADRLRANGWSKRPDVTMANVEAWLYEYGTRHAPGCPPVAMFWEQLGRRFCYLTGWFGEKGQRKRAVYDGSTVEGRKGSKRRTPEPPPELLAAVLRGDLRADGFPPGNLDFPPGNAAGSKTGNLNDSVPARENEVPARVCGVPANSRGFPAPVVPVADEDEDADASEGEGTAPPTPIRRGGLRTKPELRDATFPLTASLISSLALLGVRVGHPDKDADSAAVEANCARDGVEIIASRVIAAYRLRPKSTLGWFLDAMAAPPPKPRPKGMAIPDTDWTSEAATKL